MRGSRRHPPGSATRERRAGAIELVEQVTERRKRAIPLEHDIHRVSHGFTDDLQQRIDRIRHVVQVVVEPSLVASRRPDRRAAGDMDDADALGRKRA